MRYLYLPLLTFCALVVIGFAPCPASALEVAAGGKVRASVLYRADDAEPVVEAAAEVARVLGEMTGDEVTAQAVKGPGAIPRGPAIVLGALAESAGLAMNGESASRDGFRYKVTGDRVLVVSESPRGLYGGAHHLLGRFGCGWYMPGDVGEVIPKKKNLSLSDDLDHTELSTAMHRRFWYGGGGWKDYDGAWLRRLNGNFVAGSWRHAYGHLVPKKNFEAHPEWFAFYRGKRTSRQLCGTHETVKRIAAETLIEDMNQRPDQWIFAAGPNDGGGICECDECMRWRAPAYVEPSSGKANGSSQVFRFAAEVAARTAKVHPDKHLGILVYSDYSRIPVKIDAVSPNVFPMVAPIRRCRLHGPGNPLCEWNVLLAEEIQAWAKLAHGSLGFYVYNYNLADTQVPLARFSFFKRMQEQVKIAELENLAWTMETMDAWATHGPHMWLSVRLAWDHTIDIDAELERFFNGFYGAAAGPMAAYWRRIDRAYANTDAHTGSQYALHHVWTPKLLAACRADIARAKKVAANDREREAVAMAEAGLRCAELFMAGWDALGAFDFAAAAKHETQLERLITTNGDEAHRPSWFRNRYSWGYHKRFVGPAIRSGAAALEGGGRIVVKLPEQWRFAIDPEAQGRDAGWHAADFDDAEWREAGTFTESWADLSIGYGGFYHGDAWYRADFELPAAAKGKDLRLWFGGFDHNVDVYLNGERVGELTGFIRPGEIDAIEKALRYGARNVIAVRTNAGGLAELGTGGIMMPVMIYAAGDGEASGGEGGKDGTEYEM